MEDQENEGSLEGAIEALENDRGIFVATLASMPDTRFLNAVWAVRALQTGNADRARKIMRSVPDDAIGADISSRYAIHPWELELLINERLALGAEALFQFVAPEPWPQIAGMANLLRKIENNESAVFPTSNPLADLLFKIANRQFEWQIGFLTKQNIFRTAFIYGQGSSAEHFHRKYGITINQFSATCFAYFSIFLDAPNTFRNVDLSVIGITPDIQRKALDIVSRPIRVMKNLAARDRDIDCEMAYKPSIIRKYPIIGVSAKGFKVCCPLPELLVNRMTYGLFYDIIDGGGSIRDEIGSRFEEYLSVFFQAFMPDIAFRREFTISDTRGSRKSCDIIVFAQESHNTVDILLECKATRLSYKSRFEKFDQEDRGYNDMIKGVVQIWRTASDIRRGLTPFSISDKSVGAIVTLDAWFVAAPARQESILHAAKQKIDGNDHITTCDMIPISFLFMPELERSMSFGSRDSLLNAIRELSKPENRGYSLDYFAIDRAAAEDNAVPFPFDDKMGEILPWWGDITERIVRR